MVSHSPPITKSDDIYNNESRLEELHHPKMRRIFIQLGRTFEIPDSIIRIIYLILQSSIKYEEDLTRCFHRNILLMNVLLSQKDTKSICRFFFNASSSPDKYTLNLLYESLNGNERPFAYRIPIGRDCEWCIKNSSNKKLIFNNDHSIKKIEDIRERLFLEINILGEEEYIYTCDDILVHPIPYKPASRKVKLHYLNTSSFDEIYNDYSNFKEVKGGGLESLYTLYINNFGYGDVMYFSP